MPLARGEESAVVTEKSNALIHESSPYLLQHAHNPVNWLPWGEEAFALARMQDKPIFLSIGYSTCHWCHVMEHESFEDSQVAEVLNRYFIAIKVDREERPDIDAVYMHAAQLMNVSGGWPLNLLLTPDKKPFYAATYLPKEGRFGRMGLIELAQRVGVMWKQDRQRIEASANSISSALTDSIAVAKTGAMDMALVDAAYRDTAQRFDKVSGGFGGAPLFPSPQRLLFLLRYGILKDQPQALTMVKESLTAMQRGGIHDQLGGGFHRYSTDAHWLLPHFEKMLSDQAMLMMAYAEGWKATGDASFAATARDTAEYLLRDMRDKQDGFYTAEDADSEGEEGRFYLWSADEIRHVLGRRADAFMKAYGVEADGNFSDEASHEKTGANILHRTGEMDPAAFAAEREKLLASRAKRVRPFRDDKVLADWNGLTIAALAITGRILDEPRYIEAATKAADFILHNLRRDDGSLLHRWRRGEAGIAGQLDDYTDMVWGLTELYEATFDARWLKQALALNHIMLSRFKAEGGGFYQVERSDDLIARPMQGFDGALPSGNAVAMHNLLRLSRLTGDAALAKQAAAVAGHFSDMAEQAPSGLLHLLSAELLAESPGKEVVLVGDRSSAGAGAMLAVLHERYRPNTVVLWHDAQTEELAPFTRGQKAVQGKVTVYVCENYRCKLPSNAPAVVRELLDQ
ncbi:thioredoxin domain-containing protein [Mariprofundus ferrooxydans]|uniref:thioredoxin domain-containing protein n=1 Tax=Mariprofundus ferrooxydans TaxID=314344 RepID=UPI0005690A3D